MRHRLLLPLLGLAVIVVVAVAVGVLYAETISRSPSRTEVPCTAYGSANTDVVSAVTPKADYLLRAIRDNQTVAVHLVNRLTNERRTLEVVPATSCVHGLAWDSSGRRAFYAVTTWSPTIETRFTFLDLDSPDPFAVTTIFNNVQALPDGFAMIVGIGEDFLIIQYGADLYKLSLNANVAPSKLDDGTQGEASQQTEVPDSMPNVVGEIPFQYSMPYGWTSKEWFYRINPIKGGGPQNTVYVYSPNMIGDFDISDPYVSFAWFHLNPRAPFVDVAPLIYNNNRSLVVEEGKVSFAGRDAYRIVCKAGDSPVDGERPAYRTEIVLTRLPDQRLLLVEAVYFQETSYNKYQQTVKTLLTSVSIK